MDALFGGAMRMTLKPADAEHLVSRTMVLAYNSFATLHEGANLKVWLFGIQADAHDGGGRERMRRPAEPPIDMTSGRHPSADAERAPSTLRSGDLDVLELMPDDDIRIALDALPLNLRMAVYYADVEGLAYKQISDITSTPLDTVVCRIRYGRSRLRVLLADLAAESRQRRGSRADGVVPTRHRPRPGHQSDRPHPCRP